MKPRLDALVVLPQRVLITLVKAYRLLLSPWLGSACRFEPTCSVYSLQALQQYGAVGGSYLTLRRLGRCHPWCEGGCDPVPSALPAPFFRRVLVPPASQPSEKTPS
ncbi:MAG: membrane protein insertion efficiency factor YidD [Polaromonas sp.]